MSATVDVPPVTTAAIDIEIALKLVTSPIAVFTDASDLDTHDATIDTTVSWSRAI